MAEVDDEADPARAADATLARSLPRGSETVLVLEDDSALREMIWEILEGAGYTVLAQERPEEALEAATTHPGPIHLILTDVVMPRLSGSEAVERLRAVRPQAKVLYMSGYTDGTVARRAGHDLGTSFIEKPFTAAALLRQLRELLGEPPPQPPCTSHSSCRALGLEDLAER